MKLWDETSRRAQALIAHRLGLDFPETRQADLERGLVRACRTSSTPVPETYLTWLATLPDESPEWQRLAGYLTVGETYFFRDRAAFEALEHQILPSLIAARRAQGLARLRLWSAGCATGEEPYSLAILLDRLLPDRVDWTLTILATDINPEALEAVRRGCYRPWALRDTPAWIRERYFHRRGGESFELDARIRGMVTCAALNLAADGYHAATTNTNAMDLILCRNVLMYLTRETQRAAVAGFQRALVSGGWLMVSPAEASADIFSPLAPMNFPGAILYRKASPPPVSFPAREEGRASQEERTTIPPDTPTDLQRARTLADRGHLEQARHLCEAALAQGRLALEPYLLLAVICQEQGEGRAAGEALRRAIYLAPASAPLPSTHSGRRVRIIAIGASTGGPAALAEILRELPGHLSVPIAVVQHITPGFIAGMAEWLGHETRLTVKVAQAGEGVSPGRVYLAPTGRQMGLTHTGRISLKQESGDDGFCPSASYLFRSVAEVYGASAIGILLTGMGRDGAAGLRHLQEAGGVTIAQDEESSVVFGMPGEAVRLGAAAHVMPPRRIAHTICALVPCR